MKQKIFLIILSYCCFVSCIIDEEPSEAQESNYTPIIISRADLEKSIKLKAPQPIKNAGKIYMIDNLIFINEKYEGVHIYDNTDPTNPDAIGFIKILGNIDIAIKDNIIYADNAVDLVALSYHNNHLEILHRNRNVFPEIIAPDFGSVPDIYNSENRPSNTVIIGWEEK